MPITLEAKLKALREVESIYALAKKWKKLTPDEKPPNWERLADGVLKKALSEPVQPEELELQLQPEHAPRARPGERPHDRAHAQERDRASQRPS